MSRRHRRPVPDQNPPEPAAPPVDERPSPFLLLSRRKFLDELRAKRSANLAEVRAALGFPPVDDEDDDSPASQPTNASKIVNLIADSGALLFRDPAGRPQIAFTVTEKHADAADDTRELDGTDNDTDQPRDSEHADNNDVAHQRSCQEHTETHPLRSRAAINWIARRYYESFGAVPTSQNLQEALNVLEGRAVHDSSQLDVHLRLAEHAGAIYIDLGDDAWRAVEIDASGWRVIADPPIRFRRPAQLLPLPAPAAPLLNCSSNPSASADTFSPPRSSAPSAVNRISPPVPPAPLASGLSPHACSSGATAGLSSSVPPDASFAPTDVASPATDNTSPTRSEGESTSPRSPARQPRSDQHTSTQESVQHLDVANDSADSPPMHQEPPRTLAALRASVKSRAASSAATAAVEKVSGTYSSSTDGHPTRAEEKVPDTFSRPRSSAPSAVNSIAPPVPPAPQASSLTSQAPHWPALLRKFLNISDDHWPLVLGWLVAALRPRGPYPVLCLHGEQGSAKSTAALLLRSLVDPNAAPLRGEPKEVRDLMIAATHSHVLCFDNLSRLPDWLSNALCRLSTGGGFSTRTLYENDVETIFSASRPSILVGIDELATRGDLIDRAVLVTLSPIDAARRRPEEDLLAEFAVVRPAIFGGLCTALSTALANLPTTKLARYPRMADFARWATAAEPALGLEPGEFLRAYENNRATAHELALEGHPLVAALEELLEARDDGYFETSATGFLDALKALTNRRHRRDAAWPKSPRALSGTLRRLAPALRTMGIDVRFHRGDTANRTRVISIGRKPE